MAASGYTSTTPRQVYGLDLARSQAESTTWQWLRTPRVRATARCPIHALSWKQLQQQMASNRWPATNSSNWESSAHGRSELPRRDACTLWHVYREGYNGEDEHPCPIQTFKGLVRLHKLSAAASPEAPTALDLTKVTIQSRCLLEFRMAAQTLTCL